MLQRCHCLRCCSGSEALLVYIAAGLIQGWFGRTPKVIQTQMSLSYFLLVKKGLVKQQSQLDIVGGSFSPNFPSLNPGSAPAPTH